MRVQRFVTMVLVWIFTSTSALGAEFCFKEVDQPPKLTNFVMGKDGGYLIENSESLDDATRVARANGGCVRYYRVRTITIEWVNGPNVLPYRTNEWKKEKGFSVWVKETRHGKKDEKI